MNHFEGKSALEHLQEARLKTKSKLKENHAVETKSFIDALVRLMSEVSIFIGIIQVFKLFTDFSQLIELALVISFLVFRVMLCALDGYARLQRLHRVISEERFEIEHHEAQERDELNVIYQGKGFEGKLLEDVVSVLMADRNRLLSVMLDEELGLKLEAYDHPLLQASGAMIGGLGVLIPMGLIIVFLPFQISIFCTAFFVFISALLKAYIEKISRLKTTVWHLANFSMLLGLIYFGLKSFLG